MKKLMDVLALTGNMVGALLVASVNVDTQLIGYCFFVVGAAASVWLLMYSTASRSLVFINLYFMAVNIYGIVNRVGA